MPNYGPEQECAKGRKDRVWYLGFASMMNKKSLANRGIDSSESFPVIVPGYTIGFDKMAGFAAIVKKGEGMGDRPEMHAVVHKCTPENFEQLDQAEGRYICIKIECLRYPRVTDGEEKEQQQQQQQQHRNEEEEDRSITAWTYAMTDEDYDPPSIRDRPWKLPTERYLDILTRGGAAHGVSAEYLAKLKALPCLPRKKVSEYEQFTVKNDRTMTKDEFDKFMGDELDRSKYCCVIVNQKVILEVIATRGNTCSWPIEYGADKTLFLATTVYEPQYPIAQSLEAMSEDHKAWCEDLLVTYFRDTNFEYECVAKLV